ncbi:MAG: hypothetical protein M1836_008078 [Candelina mexicana]|nr:MAG: hypothetical protein M1836_008078 [Candelina mexicana]
MATERQDQEDPTPRLGDYFVPRNSPEYAGTPGSVGTPSNDPPTPPDTQTVPPLSQPAAAPDGPLSNTTPASSSFHSSFCPIPPSLYNPNFPEFGDMIRQDMAEERQKKKEADAQEAYDKAHETVYKFSLPTSMQATFKKMLFSPTFNKQLTEETSEWVPTIIIFTSKGRMMGNSEGKYTPYNDKVLKSIAAIAAARWRQEYNELLPNEAPTPPVPASNEANEASEASTITDADLSTLTLEDPAKMSAAKKKLLSKCVCKDPQILALRKLEFSDLTDPSEAVNTTNILIWEVKPRLLMCLIGPKRNPKKQAAAAETSNTSDDNNTGPGTTTTNTTKDPYDYAHCKDLEWCNAQLKDGDKPWKQEDVDRTKRVLGPLIMLRLKAQDFAKYLIEELEGFKLPESF